MKYVFLALTIMTGATALAAVDPYDGTSEEALSCSSSVIVGIGPRLKGDFKSGIKLYLENGTTQVGFQLANSILSSRTGDEVLICIADSKATCPNGDKKRLYTTTNLRTLDSWTLPDSDSGCADSPGLF